MSVPDSSLWAGLSRRLADSERQGAYGRRATIESNFSAIKRRYDDRIRSRSHAGQTNELYCVVIAHNLHVLAHEMFYRRVDPTECGLSMQNGWPHGTSSADGR